ncbi:MAG: DUF554 domain-containing protein [Bacteroidetes bacterium]|nr:DUF554 domain-containing protein [Bacteroidota bacterium]
MLGTVVNVAAVMAGTIIGVLIQSKLPKKVIEIIFQVMGLFTLLLGMMMALKMQQFVIGIGSLVLGSIIGELIGLEKYMNRFSEWVKSKVKLKNDKFSDGLITAFLLYCMGSLTILGAIEEGINGNSELLLMKSLMDGVSSVALASALGIGVGFSAIPLLIYQGGLTLLASSVGSFFTEPIINELSAVGGVLLIGLGINILEIKKLRILNMIPSLMIVVILVYFLT